MKENETKNCEQSEQFGHETEVKLPPIDEEKCKKAYKEMSDYIFRTTLEDSDIYQGMKTRHKPATKEEAFLWYKYYSWRNKLALKLFLEQKLQITFENYMQFQTELIEFTGRSV